MKIIKSILLLGLVLLSVRCEDDVAQYNFEKYKFVSFVDENAEVAETYTEENKAAYPIYLKYDGSILTEDFTATLKITGNNATEGTDYTVENTTVSFKAGEILSEPFYINTVDDLLNSTNERSLDIVIESVSNTNISIGVGIVNQSNKLFVLTILDNECDATNAIFNSSDITSASGEQITGSVTADEVVLTGNLIDYGTFPNAELGITLIPTVAGASVGAASFSDYLAGTDNDGYEYQFRQNGEGTYDLCNGIISVVIDVYYESGGEWVFWRTNSNSFSLP